MLALTIAFGVVATLTIAYLYNEMQTYKAKWHACRDRLVEVQSLYDEARATNKMLSDHLEGATANDTYKVGDLFMLKPESSAPFGPCEVVEVLPSNVYVWVRDGLKGMCSPRYMERY